MREARDAARVRGLAAVAGFALVLAGQAAEAAVLRGFVHYADAPATIGPARQSPVRNATISVSIDGSAPTITRTRGDGGFQVSLGTAVPARARLTVRVQAMVSSAGFVVAVRPIDPAARAYTYAFDADVNPADVVRIVIPEEDAAPFNILDVAWSAVSYLRSIDPRLASRTLTLRWPAVSNYFDHLDPRDIHVKVQADKAFLDDSIAHEVGHWAEYFFSRSDSPGGASEHDRQIDPRVAFSEGWAIYFASAVQAFRRAVQPWKQVWLDQTVTPPRFLELDFERPSPVFSRSQTNMVAVAAALWDLRDDSDAEAFDTLRGQDALVWLAMKDLRGLPAGETTTFDAWFRRFEARSARAAQTAGGRWSREFAVDGAFEAVDIRFYPDGKEPNDTRATAAVVTESELRIPRRIIAGQVYELKERARYFTLLRRDAPHKGDVDWYRYQGETVYQPGEVVQVRVRVERVHEQTWGTFLGDGGDFQLEVFNLDGARFAFGDDGLGLEGLPDHEDEVVANLRVPDGATNWTPQVLIRVARTVQHALHVHFGYYLLRVQTFQVSGTPSSTDPGAWVRCERVIRTGPLGEQCYVHGRCESYYPAVPSEQYCEYVDIWCTTDAACRRENLGVIEPYEPQCLALTPPVGTGGLPVCGPEASSWSFTNVILRDEWVPVAEECCDATSECFGDRIVLRVRDPACGG